MKTIAILNGYKMILPHYGKYNGIDGYFVTEGFVSCDDGLGGLDIQPLEYDKIRKVSSKDVDVVFEALPYPKF
jgi:hypothetical protein